MHLDLIEDRMNFRKIYRFLKKLKHNASYPVFVIADNARYHHNKQVQGLLKSQSGEIMMDFLPAYSPELNPDEQVWNHAKADVGKRSFQSKNDMERVNLSAMRTIQGKTDLAKIFYQLPDTYYAKLLT